MRGAHTHFFLYRWWLLPSAQVTVTARHEKYPLFSIMKNFGVIFRYYSSKYTYLIKLHITVLDLPVQEDDICTHERWNGCFSCQFLMTFLNKLLRMTNLHMRSKEFRAAVSRILGQFVFTLCQAFLSNFTLILTNLSLLLVM